MKCRRIETPSTVQQTEMSDGVPFAPYRTLEELRGLIFGLMTVIYIFLSLARLAP